MLLNTGFGMTSPLLRLIAASAVALVVGLMVGIVSTMAFLTASEGPRVGSWTVDQLGLLAVLAGYNIVLGLLPGLMAHIGLVWVKRTRIAPYMVAAASIGVAWCVLFGLPIQLQVYVLTSALAGTAAFWLVRRPDRIAEEEII